MTIENLAKQGRTSVPSTLAGIDTQRLSTMRNESLRGCFKRMGDSKCRLQQVARIHNKTFVNDAASCNTNATWFALESIQAPIIWIANTPSENVDYTNIKPVAQRKVSTLYCVGTPNSPLHQQMEGVVQNIVDVKTLSEALTQAMNPSFEEATVLYSPSCDNGVDYEDLGNQFVHEVNEL